MKEYWLNDIHDKMSDFETAEPDNLWSDICAGGSFGTKPVLRPRRRWYRTIAAAAAVICVIATATFLLLRDGQPIRHTRLIAKAVIASDNKQATAVRPTATADITPIPKAYAHTAADAVATEPAPQTTTEPAIIEAAPATDGEQNADENRPAENNEKATADTSYPVRTLPAYSTNVYTHETKKMSRSESRIYFDLYANGSIGNDIRKQETSCFDNLIPDGNPSSGFIGIGDSPITDLQAYKDLIASQETAKHRIPIRIGLSMGYRLTDRLSLTTGIVYSNLSSDLNSSLIYYSVGEQTLHYIGIPVGIKYNLFSWKSLNLYAAAGAMGEKCVDGTVKRNYYYNGSLKETETQDATVKPLQWSVNASAGIQYNANSAIGVYAEPGINYYFDNGSSINTIYKEKPLHFSLNVGLRFTVGR